MKIKLLLLVVMSSTHQAFCTQPTSNPALDDLEAKYANRMRLLKEAKPGPDESPEAYQTRIAQTEKKYTDEYTKEKNAILKPKSLDSELPYNKPGSKGFIINRQGQKQASFVESTPAGSRYLSKLAELEQLKPEPDEQMLDYFARKAQLQEGLKQEYLQTKDLLDTTPETSPSTSPARIESPTLQESPIGSPHIGPELEPF